MISESAALEASDWAACWIDCWTCWMNASREPPSWLVRSSYCAWSSDAIVSIRPCRSSTL